MPVLSSLDTFIEKSCLLLQAHPTTTRVTTTYKTTSSKEPGARIGIASVKTYDPVSGGCFKVSIRKTKQLARVMSALGPRTVELTKAVPDTTLTSTEETDGKPKLAYTTKTVKLAGMASIMCNVVPISEQEIAPEPSSNVKSSPAPGTTGGSAAGGKKSKKKKGKK